MVLGSAGFAATGITRPPLPYVPSGPTDSLLFHYKLESSSVAGTDRTEKVVTVVTDAGKTVGVVDMAPYGYVLSVAGATAAKQAYLRVADFNGPTSKFTYMLRARPTSFDSAPDLICSRTPGDVSSNQPAVSIRFTAAGQWRAVVAPALSTAQFCTSSLSYPLNAWYHVALVHDTTILRLYVNGSQVATASCNSSIRQGTVHTLFSNLADARYFNGQMDDVRIYNRVISSTDIATIFNNP